MKSLARGFVLSVGFVATSALLHAHPGHDGHDLTWDFSHLAAYPAATAGWLLGFAALGVSVWIGRRRAARSHAARISR